MARHPTCLVLLLPQVRASPEDVHYAKKAIATYLERLTSHAGSAAAKELQQQPQQPGVSGGSTPARAGQPTLLSAVLASKAPPGMNMKQVEALQQLMKQNAGQRGPHSGQQQQGAAASARGPTPLAPPALPMLPPEQHPGAATHAAGAAGAPAGAQQPPSQTRYKRYHQQPPPPGAPQQPQNGQGGQQGGQSEAGPSGGKGKGGAEQPRGRTVGVKLVTAGARSGKWEARQGFPSPAGRECTSGRFSSGRSRRQGRRGRTGWPAACSACSCCWRRHHACLRRLTCTTTHAPPPAPAACAQPRRWPWWVTSTRRTRPCARATVPPWS